MRKIINKNVYDTDTAIKVLTVITRPEFQESTLYRTRSGNYFLTIKCKATVHFEFSDNVNGYGLYLVPISREHATSWALQYVELEDLPKEFGDIEEVQAMVETDHMLPEKSPP